MGSFHSDDIDMLRALPTTKYQAPSLPTGLAPIQLPHASTTVQSHNDNGNDAARRLDDAIAHAASCSLGREIKEAHFLLDPEWTFVNHGAWHLLRGVARKCLRLLFFLKTINYLLRTIWRYYI